MSSPKSLLLIFILCQCVCSCGAQDSVKPKNQSMMTEKKYPENPGKLPEAEWKKILSPDQYEVLREKGTERPFTGAFYLHKEKGTYLCAACGNELFSSEMKFDSHCGWPSFDREIPGGKIRTYRDTTHGMIRTEIVCASCDGHLGHLFDDGPTETGMRYCVNSLSLDFKPETKKSSGDK